MTNCSSTNRDLTPEDGGFRQDLVYRLGTLRVHVPPFRERRPDITRLVDHFWPHYAGQVRSEARLTPATVRALTAHDWPGNVRELQNALAALGIRRPRRGEIGPEALPPALREVAGHQRRPTRREARMELERAMVRDALDRHHGVVRAAGRELGVTRQGLAKIITRLEIDRPPDRSSHLLSR